MKLFKLLRSPYPWLVVGAIGSMYMYIATSINTVEVINTGTAVAHDFRLIVVPTNKVYILGDIAPGQSKSKWFVALHDGQARFIATVDNVQVTGFAIGYFSAMNGQDCTVRLPDDIGKKGSCMWGGRGQPVNQGLLHHQ